MNLMTPSKGDDADTPELIAECVAAARLEFSNDLSHHLSWMKSRCPGSHLEEAKHLRSVLGLYIDAEGNSV